MKFGWIILNVTRWKFLLRTATHKKDTNPLAWMIHVRAFFFIISESLQPPCQRCIYPIFFFLSLRFISASPRFCKASECRGGFHGWGTLSKYGAAQSFSTGLSADFVPIPLQSFADFVAERLFLREPLVNSFPRQQVLLPSKVAELLPSFRPMSHGSSPASYSSAAWCARW